MLNKPAEPATHLPDLLSGDYPDPIHLLGGLAISGEITLVQQIDSPDAGLLRYLTAYATAGRKNLLPFGTGMGVKTLYCYGAAGQRHIRTRAQLVEERDPHVTSKQRAGENLHIHTIDHKTRESNSLVTIEGRQTLLQKINECDAALVVFDELGPWISDPDAKSLDHKGIQELFEKLTTRGIGVLIFAQVASLTAARRSPLDPLPYNLVFISEDRRTGMNGGARLKIERRSGETDSTPKSFEWWYRLSDSGFEFSHEEDDFAPSISSKQKEKEDRLSTVKQMIAEGLLQKDVAERIGVNASTISRDVEELIGRGDVQRDRKTAKLSLVVLETAEEEGQAA
jgi:hypothetical protein